MNWLRNKPVVYVSEPPLEEAVIQRALATDIDNLPIFQAVMQIIDKKIEEATESAIPAVGNHGIVASEVGCIQGLRELRGDLIALREQGKED